MRTTLDPRKPPRRFTEGSSEIGNLFSLRALRDPELMSRADIIHRIAGEHYRQTIYQGSETGTLFESAWRCGCSASFIFNVRCGLRWTVCIDHHEALMSALNV